MPVDEPTLAGQASETQGAGRDTRPRFVGRYVLVEQIASGGMASVFLGRLRGPAGFSRAVAVKRLHPQHVDDPEFVAMLVDEARLATRIRHPNVVPTLDVVADGGELFLVLDYVLGVSASELLREVAARGVRVPPAVAVAIVAGVLDGLEAAHEAKDERGEPMELVHRDVSPQNVLVGRDGVTRLVDFGIAKAAWRLQTTHDGQLKGKYGYMAPEQVTDAGVDRRTDVFAASIVLWELLTGRRLFTASHPSAVLQKVVEARVARPSEYVADLPPGLDAVVLRGLAAHPAQRFASARAMAVALEEALAPAPPRAVGEWIASVAGELIGRRSMLLASVERFDVADPEPSVALAPIAAREPAAWARPPVDEDPNRTLVDAADALAPPAGGVARAGEPSRATGEGARGADFAREVSSKTTGSGREPGGAGETGARDARPPTWWRKPAASALVAAVAALTIFVLRHREGAPSREAGPAPVAGASEAAVHRPAADVPAPADVPADAEVAAPPMAASTRGRAGDAPSTKSRARVVSAPRPVPQPGRCTNPYSVDERGIRHPRPECF